MSTRVTVLAIAVACIRPTTSLLYCGKARRSALGSRMRAHSRQLGDRRDPKGVQATTRLVQECAYEHWHRMLFARFLAETDLLIEPALGVAITLDEVQELSREKGTDWLPLASDYALKNSFGFGGGNGVLVLRRHP